MDKKESPKISFWKWTPPVNSFSSRDPSISISAVLFLLFCLRFDKNMSFSFRLVCSTIFLFGAFVCIFFLVLFVLLFSISLLFVIFSPLFLFLSLSLSSHMIPTSSKLTFGIFLINHLHSYKNDNFFEVKKEEFDCFHLTNLLFDKRF